MNHIELVDRIGGVTLHDLKELTKGKVTAAIAERLGDVVIGDVQAFIAGRADEAMRKRLGVSTMAVAADLANAAGREGAIGIIIGLLLASGTPTTKG